MPLIIEHDLDVNAPAETVWQVISGFEHYSEWNPFVVACTCHLEPGSPIDMKVVLGNARPRDQREYISALEPGRHFAYVSPKQPSRWLSSDRSHTITPLADGRSRYVSRFELRGWLLPLLRLILAKPLRAGFEGMSQGIKQRAETLAGQA